MKIKRLSSAVMLCVLSAFCQTQAFELAHSMTKDLEPIVCMSRDESGVTVEYEFPGAFLHEDDLYPGTFNFSIPGFGANGNPGEGAWLIHWDTFEIPYGCDANVQELGLENSTFDMSLAPARPDLINSSDEVYSSENVPPIAEYPGWYPENAVARGAVKVFRDRNILYVGVYPISYNMRDGLVSVVDRLSYRVSFIPCSTTLSSQPVVKKRHNVDGTYMETAFTNINSTPYESSYDDGQTLEDPVYDVNLIAGSWIDCDSYLILSKECYAEAVNRFADWKKGMGYNVDVVMSDNWTPESIKHSVQSKYDSDQYLKYLLLFGDEIDLPGELHKPDVYPFYTDYFYSCMDGEDDDLPDLFSGRISVSSLEDANNVVDKIINYEKLMTSGKDKALLCAEFSDKLKISGKYYSDGYEDRRFTRTSEDIAFGLTSEGKEIERVYYYLKSNNSNTTPTNWAKSSSGYGYGEEIPSYLKDTSFNWNGNKNDIINSINSNVGYVLHRDHGAIQKWSNPQFSVSDVACLNNRGALPIIFSFNCLTGMFQYYEMLDSYDRPNDVLDGRSSCLAESFLRKKNGGGVAVFAASQLSLTKCNDVLAMEMFKLIWPSSEFRGKFPGYTPTHTNGDSKPIRKLGALINASKLKLSEVYPGTSSNHNNQIYHLFGDPSMEIREPKNIVIPIAHIKYAKDSLVMSQAYEVTMSSEYTLVRVPKKNNLKVSSFRAPDGKYTISAIDRNLYTYFITGYNVAPTPLSYYYISSQSDDSMKITDVETDGNVMRVKYMLPEKHDKARIYVIGITEGEIRHVVCDDADNEVSIDMTGTHDDVYVIELESDGKTMDSKKIIWK